MKYQPCRATIIYMHHILACQVNQSKSYTIFGVFLGMELRSFLY